MSRRFGYLLCTVLFIPVFVVASKALEYPVTEIPDSLKKNAGAVVRYNKVTLNIPDIHKYTFTEEKVITILNSSQEDLAVVKVWYNDRETIKNFKGWLFDAEGNMVKQLSKQDAEDYSATPGFVLIGTARAKIWDFKKLKNPYTIKYVYETEVKGTFHLPQWVPAEDVGISVQQATFSLNLGEEVYINYETEKVKNDIINQRNFLWEVNGFKAIKKDDYISRLWPQLPHVYLMAKKFEMYGFTGSSETWNDIGVFMNMLYEGRETLGPVDDKLNAIINSTANEKEKIKLIYKYLQDNFRYVCIDLGIGGWQPQEASFTMQKKYGDCKALSMVMKAMLKKAGIESYLTLIDTRNNRIDLKPGFPHSYFDHVILCVPLVSDTIWLECTSQTDPYNYLSNFTSNRHALMVFDGGARVVKTPLNNEKKNISTSKSLIKLNTDNSVSISASITKQAELQDHLRAAISNKDSRKIESVIYDASHLKNAGINSYQISSVEADTPGIAYTLELKDEGTIKKTQSRLFIKTDIFSMLSVIPDKNDNRTQPVHVGNGFTQFDTLIYKLPVGYEPENFKAEDKKEFTDKFGYANNSLKYSPETGELMVIRNFCLKHGNYPIEQYPDFRDFLLKAIKTSYPELVLKKKE